MNKSITALKVSVNKKMLSLKSMTLFSVFFDGSVDLIETVTQTLWYKNMIPLKFTLTNIQPYLRHKHGFWSDCETHKYLNDWNLHVWRI